MGCLLGGWIAEKVGRIKVIALGSIWGVFGASLQCSAQNSDWMICGMAASLHWMKGVPSLMAYYSSSHQWDRHGNAKRYRSCLGMLFSSELLCERAMKTNIAMLVHRNGSTYFSRYIRFNRVLPEYLRCRRRLLAWIVSHNAT